MKQLWFIIFSLILALWLPVPTQAQSPDEAGSPPAPPNEADYAALLGTATSQGQVRVIVQLKTAFQPEGSLTAASLADQRAGIARSQIGLLNRLAGYQVNVLRQYQYTPGLALTVDAAGLGALNQAPEVERILPDEIGYAALDNSTSLIGANYAWQAGYSGAGWTIAIVDSSGVDKNHPFLQGKVVAEACFSSNDPTIQATTICPNGQETQLGPGSAEPCVFPTATCYHATHDAGTAAGKGPSFSGVARDANLISISAGSLSNNFDRCSSAGRLTPCLIYFDSDVVAALEYIYSLRNNFNIAAVNMSSGGGRYFSTCNNHITRPIIDSLYSVGIVSTVSAMNNGYTDSMGAPACVTNAISVGATDLNDRVADFSNSASFLDLLAPGVAIKSAVPGGSFAFVSGTSMAAPHVAGAVAVLKSAKPAASVSEILSALQSTGRPVRDQRNGLVKPRIQVDVAVNALLNQPAVLLTKTTPDRLPMPGQQRLTYTVTAQNVTTKNVTNATLLDTLPAGITFAGPVTLQGGSGVVADDAADLPTLVSGLNLSAGQRVTVTLPVALNPGLADNLRLVNQASIVASSLPLPGRATVPTTHHNRLLLQELKLVAGDGLANDRFGTALALTGDTLVVGAPGRQSAAGAVYIFARSQAGANPWSQVKRITATDGAAADQFGYSLALSGDTLAVGAWGKNSSTGAVYLFGRNQGGANNWGLIKKLPSTGLTTGEQFGFAVALTGDLLVVGAPGKNQRSGVVYLFGRNQGGTNNWGQNQQLTTADGSGIGLGVSVALDGETLAAGAPDSGGLARSGRTYIFTRNSSSGSWSQLKLITPGPDFGGNRFGRAVALRGDTLIVGAPGHNATGAAFVFSRSQNWGLVKKLVPGGGFAGDFFGLALAFDSSGLIVGASGHSMERGLAYAFSPTTWGVTQQPVAGDGLPYDRFGTAIALNGQILAIGAADDNNNKGTVYLYTLPVSEAPATAVYLPLILK